MKVLLVGEGRHEAGGALETLVRRLSQREMQCDFRKISDPLLHAHHGRGQGMFKRAVRWLLQAAQEGYDALVLLVDHDGFDQRIREIDLAQDERRLSVLPRALGVAIRTFDAWMLADEVALRQVLQCPAIQRQPAPETIGDPKSRCDQLCCEAGRPMALSDMYKAVLQTANLDILVERCPSGFAPFAARVRAI